VRTFKVTPESDALPELQELRRAAREIFDEVLEAVDARRAVLGAVEFDGVTLVVGGTRFNLRERPRKIFSVALGKAAAPMAAALDERLGETLSAGVLSSTRSDFSFNERWRGFKGGHPLPNEASLEAARAAFDLLREADDSSALVIFLVSGGGSAMMELPRDSRLTLEDLREANSVLVLCGAPIDEVNAVRRALSAVKGGGLAACASRATQVTLVISDVGAGRAYDVASGPTLPSPADPHAVQEIIRRHGLTSKLPPSIIHALEESGATHSRGVEHKAPREFHILLDNARACEAAADAARSRGFAVEVATDLIEQPVEEGAAAMVSRLAALSAREGESGRVACLISGGEFSCPVRGDGTGGRNSETALRCAFEFERVVRVSNEGRLPARLVALSAGTDGIDGNSPAAGACSDETTLARARALGLDASKFLERSDAYSLFNRLGDALVTSATGTNVRDVRILLAG
jgi:hydroxypyruvate reductase